MLKANYVDIILELKATNYTNLCTRKDIYIHTYTHIQTIHTYTYTSYKILNKQLHKISFMQNKHIQTKDITIHFQK